MEKVSIMLNTCDKFSDLWSIFFDCLTKFWNPKYNIYINTDSKDYFDDRYSITNIHPKVNMNWSDRLYNCVENIDSEYIICTNKSDLDYKDKLTYNDIENFGFSQNIQVLKTNYKNRNDIINEFII